MIQGTVIYYIECINFAGFLRKRLPDLRVKHDIVHIKKFIFQAGYPASLLRGGMPSVFKLILKPSCA
jgi:hypothetical protein